MFEKL